MSSSKIETNERFDRLTNLDISTHYRDREFWLMRYDFLAAFAYWVVAQSPYDVPDIKAALTEFSEYVGKKIKADDAVKFTYDDISEFITEDVFVSIPEILALNVCRAEDGSKARYRFVTRYSKPDPDYGFIDLGALARNVKFMIMREKITQSL